VFQKHRKVYFLVFYFWLGLLFCRLLSGGLGELVLVMECNHGCLMDTLYELCESRFYWRIGAELSRERGDVERRRLYDAGGKEEKEDFWRKKETKFLLF